MRITIDTFIRRALGPLMNRQVTKSINANDPRLKEQLEASQQTSCKPDSHSLRQQRSSLYKYGQWVDAQVSVILRPEATT